MEDQGVTDQTEAEPRRDKGNQHSGGEARQDNNEGSAPRHIRGVRVDQHFPLEGVIGNVDATRTDVEHYRRRSEPGTRSPGGRKRAGRHNEEMDEVDPH